MTTHNPGPVESPRYGTRLLRFGLTLAVMVSLFILLPADLSGWLFVASIVTALSYGVVATRAVWRPWLRHPLASWQTFRQTVMFLWIARLSFVAAIVLVLIATYWFGLYQYYTEALKGWSFFFLAVVVLGLALSGSLTPGPSTPLSSPASQGEASREGSQVEQRPIRWNLLLVGIILLLALTQANSVDRYAGMISHHLQMLLLAAGMVIVGVALAGKHFSGSSGQHLMDGPISVHESGEGYERGTLHPGNLLNGLWKMDRPFVLIVLVALAVRVYNLEYGIHRLVDEINFIDGVIKLWYNGNQPVLLPFNGVVAFTYIFPYAQSILAALFGSGLSPLRIVAAGFGVAQVVALYALVRELFGRRTALIAALLLATFPPHIHFSRIGINNIADPLFGILTLLYLVRGLKTGQQAYFAAAGICLGLTHYFYEGGRLFYTPFIGLWLVWLFLVRLRGEYRLPSRRNLLIFAAGFLLLIFPVYYAWMANGLPLTPRFDSVAKTPSDWWSTLLGSASLFQGIWAKLEVPLMFYVYSPEMGTFYTGGRLLLIELLPFALFGAILCFWRIRSAGHSLGLVWLLLAAAALSLMSGRPQMPRYVVMFPALAMVIAVGITGMWDTGIRLIVTPLHNTPGPGQPSQGAARLRREDTPTPGPFTPLSSPASPGEASREGSHVDLGPVLAESTAHTADIIYRIPATLNHRVVRAIPLLAASVLAALQAAYYLGDFLPNYYYRQFYHETAGVTGTIQVRDFDDFLFRAVALPRETDVHLVSPALRGESGYAAFVTYYGRHGETDLPMTFLTPEQFSASYLAQVNYGRNQAFFVEPENVLAVALIRHFFPNIEGPRLSPYDIPPERQFMLFFAPADPHGKPPDDWMMWQPR